ncbi:hypothetical protein [Chryseobacterium sp. JV274]|uniref:hypothetical protein n=1 Tax=Chryseobacterium sp. JV274 TaxID=1932669 RepID=UPI0009873ECB|nr:hypothetical protein [Chryseobacterium sp. JV274]
MFQKYVLASHFDFDTTSRYSPEIGVVAVGALGLLVISVLATPKKLPYRAESYILPVILCAGNTVLFSGMVFLLSVCKGHPSVQTIIRSCFPLSTFTPRAWLGGHNYMLWGNRSYRG